MALLGGLCVLGAYYVYLPLPGTVSEPWRVMLLDAAFRAAQQTVSSLPPSGRRRWGACGEGRRRRGVLSAVVSRDPPRSVGESCRRRTDKLLLPLPGRGTIGWRCLLRLFRARPRLQWLRDVRLCLPLPPAVHRCLGHL